MSNHIGKAVLLVACTTLIGHVSGDPAELGNSQQRYSSHRHLYQTSSQENSTLRCGGIVNGTRDELMPLMYKSFEPYDRNERCVWTVRSPWAGSYEVEVIYVGYEEANDDHRLIIASFPEAYPGDQNDTFYVATGPDTLTFNGSVLVITFQTGENPSSDLRGFILSITPRSGGATDDAVDVVVDSSIGVIKHPSSGSVYPTYDTSTFVFTPFNNTFEEGRRTDVIFTNNGMSSFGCNDFLQIYVFNISSELPHKFDNLGSLCDDTQVELISNADVALMIFRSDPSFSSREKGFQLTFTRCSG